MANEFQAFLLFAWRIIKFIIDVTLDIICLCVLIVSCVLPWRTVWIIADLFDGDLTESKFRSKAAVQLLCSLYDIITLIPLIIGLVIPTRTVHTIINIKKEYDNTAEFQYSIDMRYVTWKSCFLGICDIFALVFGFASLFMPTRWYGFLWIIYDNWDDYTKDEYGKIRSVHI